MFRTSSNPPASMASFQIDGRLLRYSIFVPKLYNLCKSLGFEAGKIMPSRAVCSDESQGYPIILIAKHFSTFPFNHGRVGGIVATDRHGPHADHGKDLVIIQGSHVGYLPETGEYGVYRRLQTESHELSASCGKIDDVLSWYKKEIEFARNQTFISCEDGTWLISIDNQLLNDKREEGLCLHLEHLVKPDSAGHAMAMRSFSTSKTFPASDELAQQCKDASFPGDKPLAIGERLLPEWYHFEKCIQGDEEGRSHLEQNLLPVMPWILASRSPLLSAAKVNTQVEFDRAYRSILHEPSYQGKRVFFIAGINIDISPEPGQMFPLTKFVPWAAYLQHADGTHEIFEQEELYGRLNEQSADNPDQTDLEEAIRAMSKAKEVLVPGE